MAKGGSGEPSGPLAIPYGEGRPPSALMAKRGMAIPFDQPLPSAPMAKRERLDIPMGKEHLAIPPTYGRGRHPSAPMAKRERWPSLWPSPPFGLWERAAALHHLPTA
jgi:hypothetical protein